MLKCFLGYDDSLDVFGVPAIGGVVASLLTGMFVTMVILYVVNKLVGLRVTEMEEAEGLDIAQHGETVC